MPGSFGSRRQSVEIGIALALCWMLITGGGGCRKYQPVQSKEGLVLIRALYSACSSQDAKRLADVKQRLASAQQARTVEVADADALASIIAIAESGDWQSASREAYRLARDQVR